MFRLLAALPKLACRIRGFLFRIMVIAAGGRCGPGMRLESGLRIRQPVHRGLNFGRDIYIGRGVTFDCTAGASLSIGNDVTLTQAIFISCCQQVSIGDDVLIGEFCSIRDAQHSFDDLDRPIHQQPMRPSPIRIGRDVWIGRGCAILAGASIGDGAVVGANSLVRRDVPAMAIAVGSPARQIGSRQEA